MAISGSFATNAYNSKKWIELHWSRSSYDLGENSTTIYYEVRGCGTTTSFHKAGPITAVIDGETVYSVTDRFELYKDTVLKSGYKKIYHNNDGTRSFSASVSAAIYSGSVNCTGSGSWTLDSLPRQATLTSAPNFNDEGNPKITYSNPAGNAVSYLHACISLTGATDDIKYRDISKTGSEYTFSLTEAERNVLRNATTTSNSRTVIFFVRTMIGSNTFYSTMEKTLSIVNGNPTFSAAAYVATDSTTYSLTGSQTKFIKGYTSVTVSSGAAAKKGATLKSQKITNGSSTINSGSGTFSAVTNGTFTFSATDSRGNTGTTTLTRTIVDYVKVSCNPDIKISVGGVATIKVTGNYWNGNFGAQANTLTLQYRYKASGGSYSSWTNISNSKSGNTYSGTATLSGLNYKTTYVFQVKAVDKLYTAQPSDISTKALPVFDWDADDFAFNVPVIFNAGFTQSASVVSGLDEDEIIPTGDYVVDQGNNGSYAYRKWNSGLMEAWRSAASSVSVKADQTAVTGAYYTTQVSLTTNGEAAQFVSLENVQITVNKNGATGFWQPVIARANVTAEGAATADVFFTNAVKDATAAIIPYVYFIGRWK